MTVNDAVRSARHDMTRHDLDKNLHRLYIRRKWYNFEEVSWLMLIIEQDFCEREKSGLNLKRMIISLFPNNSTSPVFLA